MAGDASVAGALSDKASRGPEGAQTPAAAPGVLEPAGWSRGKQNIGQSMAGHADLRRRNAAPLYDESTRHVIESRDRENDIATGGVPRPRAHGDRRRAVQLEPGFVQGGLAEAKFSHSMKGGWNITLSGFLHCPPGWPFCGARFHRSAVTTEIGPVGYSSRNAAIEPTSSWLTTIASARSAFASASAAALGLASGRTVVGPLGA